MSREKHGQGKTWTCWNTEHTSHKSFEQEIYICLMTESRLWREGNRGSASRRIRWEKRVSSYNFPQIINTPRTMNRSPAPSRTYTGRIICPSVPPKTDPMRLVRIRATDAPRKTSHFFPPSAASDSVASCVLSPSSAKKITIKVLHISFKSISDLKNMRLSFAVNRNRQ